MTNGFKWQRLPSTGKKALEGKGVDMAYGRELNYSFVKKKEE